MRRVDQAQALRALLDFNNRAHQVAFLAPQLQQAAPMLLAHCVVGSAHVEEHASIFKQRCRRMVCQVVLDGAASRPADAAVLRAGSLPPTSPGVCADR